jgi:hypothetical protein
MRQTKEACNFAKSIARQTRRPQYRMSVGSSLVAETTSPSLVCILSLSGCAGAYPFAFSFAN